MRSINGTTTRGNGDTNTTYWTQMNEMQGTIAVEVAILSLNLTENSNGLLPVVAGRAAGVETWIHRALKRKGLSLKNIMGRVYWHVRQPIRDTHLDKNRMGFVITAIAGANFFHG